MKSVIFNFVLVGMVLFTVTVVGAVSSELESQAVYETLFSKIQNQNSEYVAIQFWSAHCEPCGEEVKEINKALELTNKITPNKLSAIGIPMQSRKSEINAFIDFFRPNYEQWTLNVSDSNRLLKINAVPWTILFSREKGIKTKEWLGKTNATELLAEIERLDKHKGDKP